jgi:lipopolysaccharide export system protein LptA
MMKMISNIKCVLAAVLVSPVLMFSEFVWAQASADRLTGLKLTNDQPIQIESDKLDVREAESVAEFTGNVSVVQGPTLLKAGKMVVYYAKNGGSAATGSAAIDKLDISGTVYVKSNTQIATGDAATFDMKSQVLVMTGKEVVLSDGGNVVKGCKLIVQMKSGKARFESCKGSGGRVSVLIDPKSAPQNAPKN